jgi:hypothetical protein
MADKMMKKTGLAIHLVPCATACQGQLNKMEWTAHHNRVACPSIYNTCTSLLQQPNNLGLVQP